MGCRYNFIYTDGTRPISLLSFFEVFYTVRAIQVSDKVHYIFFDMFWAVVIPTGSTTLGVCVACDSTTIPFVAFVVAISTEWPLADLTVGYASVSCAIPFAAVITVSVEVFFTHGATVTAN
jgi:hypothetical protein